MESDEASSNNWPQNSDEMEQFNRKKTRVYFFAIVVLFLLVITLGVNNIYVYRSYIANQGKYIVAFQRVKSIVEDKQNLNADLQRLNAENNMLKDKFNTLSNQSIEIQKQMLEIKKQNDELVKKNKELVDDNIALQNSIKKAASVGIEPQNFTKFNGLTSRGEIQRGKYIGNFLGTAYTPSPDECGNSNGITNSGKPIIPGISIAIDNEYWPFGTVFYIQGLGYAVAMDTGSGIKGKYRFDFAVFDKDFAFKLGSKKWPVYLIKMGNGEVGKVDF